MKQINQTVIFNASAHEVFEVLMDSKKHAQFTGDTAKISRKVGGSFKAYGDYIKGKNLEIIKDKKIVQTWYTSDWPEGQFSTVTFEIKQNGKKTKLMFQQEGVPEEQYESIKQGWIDFYWKPMKEMLEAS